MQVGGVSLDLTLIMHEQAFGDYLTDHSFLSLESVGWRTGYVNGDESVDLENTQLYKKASRSSFTYVKTIL